MINAIALDDEPPALDILKSYCERVDFISLTKTFTSPSEALQYLKKYPVDLLFLDIQMPEISGIEFRKKIDPDIMVVFTTAFSNFAVSGFDLNVIDFLLKPYSPERFAQSAEKVNQYFTNIHQKSSSEHPYIYLRADYGLVKVPLDKLIYVEGLEDYCKFYFTSGNPLIFRITMKALAEKLPANQFVRIHRSYIISIDKIERLRGNVIHVNGIEINIGRIYKQHVMDVFKGKI